MGWRRQWLGKYGGFEQRQWLNGHDFWVMTKLGFVSGWVSVVFGEDDIERERLRQVDIQDMSNIEILLPAKMYWTHIY